MDWRAKLIVACVIFGAIKCTAQTTVTTSAGGTANNIPIFTSTSTVENSIITQSNGNIGIGTANPTNTLHLVGDNADKVALVIQNNNAVPVLENPDAVTFLLQAGSNGFGISGWANSSVLESAATGGLVLDAYGSNGGPILFQTFRVNRMIVTNSGNVGVGTTTPGTKLEVNGNIKLTSGSGASMTFADGTVQSTAWTGSLCGGDYAESVDVTGGRIQYEPGDVLVIDPAHPGQFLKSTRRYSRLVAGIYSTKPGLVGRRQTTDPKLSSTEVPMAMVGIVPTKVTDENGPIEVGDLLVTSSLSAHAMKGGDGVLPTGTVIGKALGSLASGTGVIEVLVSLQ